MARVLSSDEAQQAITQMQSIINGGFTDQITALDNQGQQLSQPNVWDGPLAETFRNDTWPATRKALEAAKAQLDQLRNDLGRISTDIFQAGGAA